MTGTTTPQPLDAELVELLVAVGPLGFDDTTVPALREMMRPTPPASSELVDRGDVVVDAATGLVIRVQRPVGVTGAAPAVVWMHGGGFVIGSRAMDDYRFERWCPSLGVVGLSVEYRLAPDAPYPAPLDDCYAALRWVHDHASDLGVDPDRIGVGGLSAGGGLAAGLALLTRDRAEVRVAFQILQCPMLDDRQQTLSSRLDGLLMWSRTDNTYGWRSYLAGQYGQEQVAAYAAPARAEDLAGLPPAFISVGTLDGFRDEDVDYATRLNQAGVPVELHVYPGAPHGFQAFVGTRIADREDAALLEWWAQQI